MNQLIDNVKRSIALGPDNKMMMAAKKAKEGHETELPTEQLERLRDGVRRYMRENRVTQAAIGQLANNLGQSAISAFNVIRDLLVLPGHDPACLHRASGAMHAIS